MTSDPEQRLGKTPQRVAGKADSQQHDEQRSEWCMQNLTESAALIHVFTIAIRNAEREQPHDDVYRPASAQAKAGERLRVLAIRCSTGRLHSLVGGGILLSTETDGDLPESSRAPHDTWGIAH